MTDLRKEIDITCLDKFPDIGLDEIKKELEEKGVSVGLHFEPARPYASMEWIYPTAVCVGIFAGKSYLDGFLSEAGKDHYNFAKACFKKISNKVRSVPVFKVTSSGSTEKGSNGYSQSFAFSIIIKTKNDRTIKLLFDNNLSQEDWDGAIDHLLHHISENYKNAPMDELTEKIKELREDKRFTIYAIIDPYTKELIYLDDMSFHKRQKSIMNS